MFKRSYVSAVCFDMSPIYGDYGHGHGAGYGIYQGYYSFRLSHGVSAIGSKITYAAFVCNTYRLAFIVAELAVEGCHG